MPGSKRSRAPGSEVYTGTEVLEVGRPSLWPGFRLLKPVVKICEPPCLPRYNWSRIWLSPPGQDHKALQFLHRPYSLKTPICFLDFTKAPVLSSAPALPEYPVPQTRLVADRVFPVFKLAEDSF